VAYILQATQKSMVKICVYEEMNFNPIAEGRIFPKKYSETEEYSAVMVKGLVYSWCFL
jgi:hypothetical protein